ncbi:MAG: amino acid--tRNA ligase-related protein [Patescibacteria group bacterium]
MFDFIKKNLLEDDLKISKIAKSHFEMPVYSPLTYYKDITKTKYFFALLVLRHYIKLTSDCYFSHEVGAKNIDLFMMTPSVTSPMGPGSDSELIRIKLGDLETFLVDSSQFGFEPLLSDEVEKVYCYLPSMRGEDPDNRHLNQFYHCEAEITGTLDDLIPTVEGFVKSLCRTVLLMDNTVDRLSADSRRTKDILKKVVDLRSFPEITFDYAVDLLIKNGMEKYVNFTDHGKDIMSKGEIKLMNILKLDTPIWIKYFDRDRVPFYQKPDPNNKDKTINADLLFPPLKNGAFGGEVVGSGQRQDDSREMYESLKRQNNILPEPYKWYIDLRKQKSYKVTSGFGLGIERFIAWALAKDNIRDVILYPRIKNIRTYP